MKRRASTWFTLIISVFVLIATVSGSTVAANAAEEQPATAPATTLKLAILAPVTAIPTFGEPARDGALLAIEQQNAGGGILGLTVEPVIEETDCSPTKAVNATNKVINQDGVRYIIGDVCSSSSIAMSEIANAAGVLQMSPSATSPGVTVGAGGVKPYIFRACFTDPFQGAAAARFARGALSAQKAFIMLDPDNAYSSSLADAFQPEFSRSGAIAGKQIYSSSATDFSAILDSIVAAKPDVVYLPDFFNIANLVTSQAKTKGITTPFIGGDGWDSSDLDAAAASGSYFTNHWSPQDPRSEVAAFNLAFQGRYGYAPNAIAALAYDSARLLFQAMGEAGTTDTAAVKTKLEAISYQGVTGALFYDMSHNPTKSAVVMRVQADGVHFSALIPPSKPAADLTINYNNGGPGSAFTVKGSNFPPNGAAAITINGQAVPGTIAVDGLGGFEFQLSTTDADEGHYLVAASVNPSAAARFALDATAPVRPVEGSGPVVAVPGGIAYSKVIRVATDAEFPPMEYLSGAQIVGHDIDLMNAIALKLGAMAVYTNVPWENIFTRLLDGEFDAVVSSVSALPIRDAIMDFTLPYVTFGVDDDIAIAVQQGNDALRHELNQALWQLRSEGALETIIGKIAADVPAWNPHLPEWPYVAPDASSTLTYTDSQQSPTILQIPSGAVTQPILLSYVAADAAQPAPGYAFAGHAFQLDAYREGIPLTGLTFNVPVLVTLHYTEADLAGMAESALKLMVWNNSASQWEDAASTCTPASSYDRHPSDNWLAVPICHLSKFALFGQHRVVLPIVLRN